MPPEPDAIAAVGRVLDPVLLPLGFAAAQAGWSEDRGHVIFCRGDAGSPDGGCIDLVVDLVAAPAWRISEVRYWGFTADRWQLPFEADADLATQLDDLARTLPITLG
jgi:hypothetical protein